MKRNIEKGKVYISEPLAVALAIVEDLYRKIPVVKEQAVARDE